MRRQYGWILAFLIKFANYCVISCPIVNIKLHRSNIKPNLRKQLYIRVVNLIWQILIHNQGMQVINQSCANIQYHTNIISVVRIKKHLNWYGYIRKWMTRGYLKKISDDVHLEEEEKEGSKFVDTECNNCIGWEGN